MGQDADMTKQKRKPATPDAQIKPAEKGEITLTEGELDRVSGGLPSCAAGVHLKSAKICV